MSRGKIINNQRGFTIIELLIATTIFSVILLVATSGIIYLGRIFYKGISSSKTQEKVRSISEELNKSLQYSGAVPVSVDRGPTVKTLCMGDTRYYYSIGTTVDDPGASLNDNNNLGSVGLVAVRLGEYKRDTPRGPITGINASSCSACPGDRYSSCWLEKRQLLSKNMRLTEFDVKQFGQPSNNLWRTKIGIAYGDIDLFVKSDGNPISDAEFKEPAKASGARCMSSQSGGSFCAVSKLDTTLKRRVR